MTQGNLLFTSNKAPLAYAIRPQTLDEIVGQKHLLGKDCPLRKLIEGDQLASIIIYGPAGTGKTTIAEVIAKTTKSDFVRLNATTASVKEIRKEGDRARKEEIRVVLFVDEIHRFSRTQQDVLLPYVEAGHLILIGATTENPFHAINSPLLSRSHIFELHQLGEKDLLRLVLRVVQHYRKVGQEVTVDEDAIRWLVCVACGDGRKIISMMELAVEMVKATTITLEVVKSIAPSKYMVFNAQAHFDLASAYQGSIQASDPDAAVFWLAKWLESGEDPRYIARRLLVSAAEDAFSNPLYIAVAQAAYTAAAEVGRPECDIVLSAATILIATSKRDKSAAMAIWAALKDVRENLDVVIPKQMRDCHYPGAAQLGEGSYKDGAAQKEYVGVNKIYYLPW